MDQTPRIRNSIDDCVGGDVILVTGPDDTLVGRGSKEPRELCYVGRLDDPEGELQFVRRCDGDPNSLLAVNGKLKLVGGVVHLPATDIGDGTQIDIGHPRRYWKSRIVIPGEVDYKPMLSLIIKAEGAGILPPSPNYSSARVLS